MNATEPETKVILTPEQALEMLPDEKMIHTFRSLPGILVGADWTKEELTEEIRKSKCELAGPQAQAMGHCLVVWTRNEPLFVKTKDERKT